MDVAQLLHMGLRTHVLASVCSDVLQVLKGELLIAQGSNRLRPMHLTVRVYQLSEIS